MYVSGLKLFTYLMTRATDNGWENSPRGIIAGEASFDQARAIVAHQSGSLIVVTHLGGFCDKNETRCIVMNYATSLVTATKVF